jgi:hypothetical protein
MKVKKNELKDRQFTPYEITITIDDEPEHNALRKDISSVAGISRDWYRIFSKDSALERLLLTITQHTK